MNININDKVKLVDDFDSIDGLSCSEGMKKLEGETLTVEDIEIIAREDKEGHPIPIKLIDDSNNAGFSKKTEKEMERIATIKELEKEVHELESMIEELQLKNAKLTKKKEEIRCGQNLNPEPMRTSERKKFKNIIKGLAELI